MFMEHVELLSIYTAKTLCCCSQCMDVCMYLCRSVEGAGSPYLDDWDTDCSPVVHL